MTREEISEQLEKIFVKKTGFTGEISPASDIVKDLGANSIDLLDIVLETESQFKVQIPDDLLDRVRTVGDMVDFILSERGE